ncbi:uncharacterized protein DUF397 [Herbihabitans rhizosphaerae]|uniref:Uncharacterized protein DUF397 n=1 Tax=Herbihabitans rhizosphaerae TaxID=1872711 RepID=A0A4Q7L395_9PSEU|nr:DUF397 domain-containing protein [Herbihabitans rhizosphaerae]RZS43200.1 uncharacterized protein DUF397 [Herbihabitans rhizosphaerae]
MTRRPEDTGWFKSSFSGGADDNCVECRISADRVGVRDSKNRDAGALWVGGESWSALVVAVMS